MSETQEKDFTEDELRNWRSFEKVRSGGKWNMFDPRARKATGLSAEEYSFTMRNFSKLKEAAQS